MLNIQALHITEKLSEKGAANNESKNQTFVSCRKFLSEIPYEQKKELFPFLFDQEGWETDKIYFPNYG